MKTPSISRFKIVLLFIGLGLVSALMYMSYLESTTKSNTLPAAELDSMSSFELAEYYFKPEVYDIEKARYYYEQSIEEDPQGSVLHWYQLSRINFIQGDLGKAIFALEKQEEYFGDQIPNVHYMKGLVHGFRAERHGQERDWQQAEESFQTFLEFKPNSPWARIDLAWVYFAQDKFSKMFTVLDPVKNTERENPWWLNMYGLAYLHTGEPDKAWYLFREAEKYVNNLTVEDWARVYPENNPADWPQGLQEFQTAVRDNVAIAAARVKSSGEN